VNRLASFVAAACDPLSTTDRMDQAALALLSASRKSSWAIVPLLLRLLLLLLRL
jgi:hypothetical protein